MGHGAGCDRAFTMDTISFSLELIDEELHKALPFLDKGTPLHPLIISIFLVSIDLQERRALRMLFTLLSSLNARWIYVVLQNVQLADEMATVLTRLSCHILFRLSIIARQYIYITSNIHHLSNYF